MGAGVVLALSPIGDKVAQAVITDPDAKPGATEVTVPARVPPTPGAPAPTQPAVPAAPAEPALTEAQRSAAADAVAGDTSLAALGGGQSYRIVETVPWTDAGSAEVVGADVTLVYAMPVDAAVYLPGARFDDAGKSYKKLSYGVKVRQLTRVSAMVDFRGGSQVVDVAPEDGVVEELPGNARFKPRHGEGGA